MFSFAMMCDSTDSTIMGRSVLLTVTGDSFADRFDLCASARECVKTFALTRDCLELLASTGNCLALLPSKGDCVCFDKRFCQHYPERHSHKHKYRGL